MIDENDPVLALDEREQLGRAAYAAYVATGADPDGARNWRELFRPMISPRWEIILRAEVEESIENEREVVDKVLELHKQDQNGLCVECTSIYEYSGSRVLSGADEALLTWPCSTAVAAGAVRMLGTS